MEARCSGASSKREEEEHPCCSFSLNDNLALYVLQVPFTIMQSNRRPKTQEVDKHQPKQQRWLSSKGLVSCVFVFIAGFSACNMIAIASKHQYLALAVHDEPEPAAHSSYTSALAMLRCFATPHCFPAAQCKRGVPQKLQRRKKWEEQSFCIEDLKATQREQGSCLVYSFGIHTSSEWESKVAQQFGCEVHAFDPTQDNPRDLSPGVTFHKLGLQATGTDMSSTHAAEYDAIDKTLLLSLTEIMQRLGHENRILDVLMMDCEGCEWGALQHLACSEEGTRVRQIVTEFHFQKNLGLQNQADVLRAADALRCLWDQRWHIASIEASGAGPENWQYTNGMWSVLHGGAMLLYVALQKIPPDELSPAEMLEVRTMYTGNPSKWPGNVVASMKKNPPRAARPKVQFDNFTRYEEQQSTTPARA